MGGAFGAFAPGRAVAFENNDFTDMWSSSDQGSYVRLIDCSITPL